MKITRTSMLTGVERTLELDVTEEQIRDWEEGQMIQIAMPNLSPADREYMMTGITQEEWQAM